MTGLSYNSTFKSPIISPESCFESRFYTRRFGPNESTYTSRFENRDPGRFRGIRRKNRPKRFQIENESQKGGTIPGRSRHKPPLPTVLSVQLERVQELTPTHLSPSEKGSRALDTRIIIGWLNPFILWALRGS